MNYFSTYFDSNYYSRGLALYNSLLKHCLDDFHLFICCYDDNCYKDMQNHNLLNATIYSISDLEKYDKKFFEIKDTRSTVEYYFTSTPCLQLFILNKHPEVSRLTYLDADLYFYSDVKPLFDELGDSSIGMTIHNFPECSKKKSLASVSEAKTGIYNVAWLSFRNDENSLNCLAWWRKKTIEWCYLKIEDGLCADQKYLDEWPKLFESVHIFNHRGANVAPWNINDYKMHQNNGKIYLDNYPLIFFHFHGFKQINKYIYNSNLGLTLSFPSKTIKELLFAPYINELLKHSKSGNITKSLPKPKLHNKYFHAIRTTIRISIGLFFRQYLLFIKRKVY